MRLLTRPRRFVWLVLLFSMAGWAMAADVAEIAGTAQHSAWYRLGEAGDVEVQLYFFWSKKCPHCLRAFPYVEGLATAYPWLTRHSLELNDHPENVARYLDMAARLGQKAESIPAFLFCGTMVVGYDDASKTGEAIRQSLLVCRQHLQAGKPLETLELVAMTSAPVSIPLLGEIEPDAVSLPVLTLVLAGLDAFNPCAFFVLLFLLSLLVHAQSRARMLLIGGTFVLFSGLMYFLFMAAWLNVFIIMGQLQIITILAGVLAVSVGMINIKDYFWFKAGVSLSIPDSARPGLFARMRTLVGAQGLYPVLLGTVVLALFANAYEFLCTAGFPMVFTRILTLHELSLSGYYLYLVVYNIVYVIPLIVIVLVFTFTLGTRKLREEEGRTLKLISGLMMLGLGFMLVFAPQILNSLYASAGLLVAAIAAAATVVAVDRWRRTLREGT